jgi:hypothetical protein
VPAYPEYGGLFWKLSDCQFLKLLGLDQRDEVSRAPLTDRFQTRAAAREQSAEGRPSLCGGRIRRLAAAGVPPPQASSYKKTRYHTAVLMQQRR